MSQQEIDPDPPEYPGPGTSPTVLRGYVVRFRGWVVRQLPWIRQELQVPLEDPLPVPPLDAYLGLAVHVLYSHYLFLRHTRETWDRIIRDYETCWNARPARHDRARCVGLAATFLTEAFTDNETREARNETLSRELGRKMARFSEFIEGVMRGASEEEEAGGGDDEEDDPTA